MIIYIINHKSTEQNMQVGMHQNFGGSKSVTERDI